MSESKAESEAVFRRMALVCSAVTSVAGILVMTGWVTDMHNLASLGSISIPHAPASALAFILPGGIPTIYWQK